MASDVTESSEDDFGTPDEAIMDLRDKLDHLREVNIDLNAGLEKRHKSLKEAGSTIQKMSSHMNEFQMTLRAIDKHMLENKTRKLELDRMCNDLQREKGDINRELRFLSSEGAWAELVSSQQQVDEEDVATEKRLTDWAREDLFAKLDDLDALKKRYADKVADTKDQWEMYKDEMQNGRMEKRSYLNDINEVNNQIVSRFNSILKYGRQGLGDTERERFRNTIKGIGIECELRNETEQFRDTEVFNSDIEEEIDHLLRQREQMWEQNAALTAEICALESKDQGETIIPLKSSGKHIDLPNRDLINQKIPGSAEDSGEQTEEVEHFGGGISLHKCVKLTDLSHLYTGRVKVQPAIEEVFTAQDAQLDAGNDQLDMDSAAGGHDEPPPPPEDDSEDEEDEEEPEPDESPKSTEETGITRSHHHHMENTTMSDLMVSKIRGRTLGPNLQAAHKDAETVTGQPSAPTMRRPSAFSFTPVSSRSSRSKRQ